MGYILMYVDKNSGRRAYEYYDYKSDALEKLKMLQKENFQAWLYQPAEKK